MPALLELFSRVAGERLWLGTEPGFDSERYMRGWRKMIAGEWGTAFMAMDGERLTGYVSVVPDTEDRWRIGMLVDEAYRGRGIGSALLDATFTWARERGIFELYLLVFPHNHAARALYQKRGFVELERYENDVTRHTGEVWDTILMRKTL